MTKNDLRGRSLEDTLVVTNGDSAVARLRKADLIGTALPWRDVLHDGPVPAMAALEELSVIRSGFIADDLGLATDEVSTEFRARDAEIRRHASFARVEIWLEHDLYDQLQLIQILDFFRAEGRLEGLYLVQAADYLGSQRSDALQRLALSATPVTGGMLALAGEAWAAFTAKTPHALAALAGRELPELPYLAAALRRLLAELPDPVRGLTLTEERALGLLAGADATAGDLFHGVAEQEDARFLGDASFFRRLDGLAFAPDPLVEGLPGPSRVYCSLGRAPEGGYAAFARAPLKLTETGRRVLDGAVDHRVVNGADHWVGGVHVSAAAMIRYDRAGGQLVAPD